VPEFEVGAAVFIDHDPDGQGSGPFSGLSGGRVIEVIPYPEPYPVLYVIRTPGRADFPYVADRLRRARCHNPGHEHDEQRRPVYFCPDRGHRPEDGQVIELDAGV
jgi:hypothetical protein